MPHRNLVLTALTVGLLLAFIPALSQYANLFSFVSRTIRGPYYSRVKNIARFTTMNATMPRTPVYFISHGGPNLMEDRLHPAYTKLQSLGREITQTVRPKAVVVFSAHFAGEPNTIEVNTAETMPLVYDYYGFPPHYYEVQYPNTGSPALAENVISKLKSAGIKAEGVRRGLDHGVFVPFLVMFHPEKNPLGVPVVEVSLFDSDNAEQHIKLGEAVKGLREEGVVVIVSGMAVHNLRDLWRMGKEPAAYTESFDEGLREAVEKGSVAERRDMMAKLLERKDARRAHPSFEHLLPIHVGVGAAGEDMGERVWTMLDGSMSWAQYRFGEVQAVGA